MIYLILIIFQVFFVYKYDIKQDKESKWKCYYLVLFALIIVAGLRYRIGVDTIRYESSFQDFPTIYELDFYNIYDYEYDPLYLILTSVIRSITDQFWAMQLVQAFLVNSIIFWFIKRNTNKPFLAVLLYFVFLYFNFMCEIMRESCAVAMFLVAWEYLQKHKYSLSLFFCILAVLFHTSAFILFLFPILNKLGVLNILRLNLKTTFILIAVFFISKYVQSEFFSYFIFLENIGNIGDKIERYQDSDLSQGTMNIFGILSTIIPQVIIPAISVHLLKRRDNLKILDVEPMVFFCMLFSIITIFITIFYRYNNYFMMFSLIAISRISLDNKLYINRFVIKNVRKMLIVIILGLFIIQYKGLQTNINKTGLKEYMRYYPYYSVILKQKDSNREKLFLYYNAY